jgi:isoprenylcysteine carboxyl methyltransferase (ICMT) family protein YpbQ
VNRRGRLTKLDITLVHTPVGSHCVRFSQQVAARYGAEHAVCAVLMSVVFHIWELVHALIKDSRVKWTRGPTYTVTLTSSSDRRWICWNRNTNFRNKKGYFKTKPTLR